MTSLGSDDGRLNWSRLSANSPHNLAGAARQRRFFAEGGTRTRFLQRRRQLLHPVAIVNQRLQLLRQVRVPGQKCLPVGRAALALGFERGLPQWGRAFQPRVPRRPDAEPVERE